jgi:hypothetical protein
MALEDETLALPALAPEFAVQGVGDGTLPVELNDPVVKDDALELRPLAEAAAAVVVHEGVLNHLERRVFHEAQRRAQVDGIVNVGPFEVCRRPQIDKEDTLGRIYLEEPVQVTGKNRAAAVLGLAVVAFDPEVLEVERHPFLLSAMVEPNLACQQQSYTEWGSKSYMDIRRLDPKIRSEMFYNSDTRFRVFLEVIL